MLEKELERELDLPRVVGSIAGRPDFAEVAVGEIGGTTDCDNAITTEARRIEVRVVGQVKDFRAELELTLLVDWKVLKDGKVQTVEAGTGNLGNATKVSKCAATSRARSRICESRGVAEPAGLAVAVGMKAELERLAGKQSAASDTLKSVVSAGQGNRLTALEGGDPLNAPTADQLVGDAAGVGHKLLALAERKLVASAQMEHIADVKARKFVVFLDAKAGHGFAAVADVVASAIQEVARI